jgi:tetratricopeptide (TPR) repeat protein
MKPFIFFLTCCLGMMTLTLDAQDLFQSDLAYGKYPVGFKAVQTTDYTRTTLQTGKPQSAGRAMQLYIWYPAEKANNNQLFYRDYLVSRFGQPQAIRAGFFRSVAELGGDTTLFQAVFPKMAQSKTKAYREPKIAPGQFPLIIYPDQVHLQQTLCEYLASWGFIVVSPVIQGPFAEPMQYNPIGIETGVADMQFALGYLRKNFPVQRDFAAMGLGFNATLALALQMRNPEVKALVSLEGGITTAFEAGLIQRGPYYNLERCTAAMLVIHAPHPDVKPELVNKYKYAERVFQFYPQSSEFYFLNFGIWERHLKNILPKANRGNTWQSFTHAAQSIQWFLHWKLGQDGKAKMGLFNPNEPKDIVSTSLKNAAVLPPTYVELLDVLQIQGFTALTDFYQERKKQDPQPLTFGSFFQMGQYLIEKTEYQHLLNWAKMYTEAYPNSAIPYSLQGRANLELGQKQEAKLHYEKALSLLPQDLELNEAEKNHYKNAIETRIKTLG